MNVFSLRIKFHGIIELETAIFESGISNFPFFLPYTGQKIY